MAVKGSVTKSVASYIMRCNDKVTVYTWACTAVSGTVSVSETGSMYGVTGEVLGFQAVNTDASDNYDVELRDENDFDILIGIGTDLPLASSGAKSRQCPKLIGNLANEGSPVFLYKDTITPYCQNMAEGKKTTLKLYVRS